MSSSVHLSSLWQISYLTIPRPSSMVWMAWFSSMTERARSMLDLSIVSILSSRSPRLIGDSPASSSRMTSMRLEVGFIPALESISSGVVIGQSVSPLGVGYVVCCLFCRVCTRLWRFGVCCNFTISYERSTMAYISSSEMSPPKWSSIQYLRLMLR